MARKEVPFSDLIGEVIDNRGRSCPTTDRGFPLIATNCIRNDLLYPTYENARFVSQDTFSNWFRGHPRAGDILFVNKATPGRVCLVPDPVGFCIAQDMVAVRANSEMVYPRYLFAVLRSPTVQEQIAQMHVGTLIPHFKKGDFGNLLIPVPGCREQHLIGDVYFNLSAKIDLNRRMSETLEAMARALFTSWFLDFDPVRARAEGRDPGLPKHLVDLFPDRVEDSEIGEVPSGWEVEPLERVASMRREGVTPLDSPDSEFAHYSIPAFDAGRIPVLELGSSIKSTKYRVHDGSVLVSKLNPEIDRVWLPDIPKDGTAICSTEFFVMEPREPWLRSYFYCLARARAFRDQLQGMVTGTSRSHQRVRPGAFLSMPLVRPADPALCAFDRIATPMLASARHRRAESQILAAIRDALLPKLVTGELRIPDAARLAEVSA